MARLGIRFRGQVNLRTAARALGSRNFRLFFAGQGVSLVGTWMQMTAVWWLAARLSPNLWLIGLLGFVPRLPTLLLAPLAGVVADRYERRRAIVITQVLAMCQAAALAALTLAGVVTFWHLFALSVLLGVVNAFDVPLRQSFIAEMAERKENIGSAIALNSFIVNGSRIVGPAVAGILIKLLGEGPCFAVNAASYLAVVTALLAMRITPVSRRPRRRVLHELGEGFVYAFRHPVISTVLPLLTLISVMGMPYMILMPKFTTLVLRQGSLTNGLLMTAVGMGAMGGVLLLASRRDHFGLPRQIASASAIFGAGLFAFSFSRFTPLAIAIMTGVGFGMMVTMVSCNTLIQTVVDDDKRGRVMSLYTMAFMGMAPFGSLFAGSLAHWIGGPKGVPYTLATSGLACVAGSIVFATQVPRLNAHLRTAHQETLAEGALMAGGVAPSGAPVGAVFPGTASSTAPQE